MHSLFQVEYAIEAVKLGSTAVGIQTREGVVLAIEKRLTSALLEPSSVEKVLEIDSHIGAAFSGLIGGNAVSGVLLRVASNANATFIVVSACFLLVADARTLVDHARIESQNHRFTFDEVSKSYCMVLFVNLNIDHIVVRIQPIGVEALTQSVCDLALGFGEGRKNDDEPKMSRPFGVALLFAGWDKIQGPQLFFSDPSGTYFQFKAKAIGAGSEGAQIILQEKYRDNMTLENAEDLLALEILKQVMEDKLTGVIIEAAAVTSQGYHLYTATENRLRIRMFYIAIKITLYN